MLQGQPVEVCRCCRRGGFAEYRLPERRRRVQQDFAMLQQTSVLPALGTADAFHAGTVHEICSGGAGEAIAAAAQGGIVPELQRQSQLAEAIDQPLAGLAVGLLASAWGRRPDQCVGEPPCVEHGLAATGPTHHAKVPLPRQLLPVLGPVALMAAQGQPRSVPAVKAQHRSLRGLGQQQRIDGHLGRTICDPVGNESARGSGGRHAGDRERAMTCCPGGTSPC